MDRNESKTGKSKSSVEVIQCWGGVPQQELLVDVQREISIGEGTELVLPRELLAVDHVLVAPEGDAWLVRIPVGATATVFVPATGEVKLDTLPCDASGVRTARLEEGARAELTLGEFSFFVRVAERTEKIAQPAPSFDWRQHTWTIASVALHGAFLIGMFFMPPNAGALNLDLDQQQARMLRFQLESFEQEQPPAPPVLEQPGADAGENGQPMTGESGAAGATNETRNTGGHVRVRGESHDERVPLTQQQVQRAGILGTLASLSLPSAISSPFGAANAMGFSAEDAYGALTASQDGFGPGAGGFGITGTGRGGCPAGMVCEGLGTVGVGDNGGIGTTGGCSREEFQRLERTLGHAGAMDRCSGGGGVGPSIGDGGHGPRFHEPRLIPEPVTTAGGLDREQIRRTVQRHLPEIRHCYEQGLLRNADLDGRVSVQFTIAPDGAVRSSVVRENLESGVDSCVQQAVTRWSFPQSPGMTMVTYPFRLTSSR